MPSCQVYLRSVDPSPFQSIDLFDSTPANMSWTFPFPTGPFVRGHAVGGGGGGGFQATEIFRGRLVRTVGIHYNSNNLRGLRLTYTDGSQSRQFGRALDRYDEITFQPGETIVRASLWGNGRGTLTGRIRFTTSRQQTFDVGRNTSGQTEYAMNVGSGILVGFAGRDGHDIDALSFIFLLHGFETAVSNVRYHQPPPNDRIRQVLLVPEAIFRNNNSTQPITWTFSNTVSRSNVWSWSQSATFNFTHNINVRARLFNIVRAESNTTWELSLESTRSATESEEIAMRWDISGVLLPGQAVRATATALSGQADVPYTATVTISAPTSPHRIVYDEPGVLSNAVYLFAEATSQKIQNRSSVEAAHLESNGFVESSESVGEIDVEQDVQPTSSAEGATVKPEEK